jgi:hypothetical protein
MMPQLFDTWEEVENAILASLGEDEDVRFRLRWRTDLASKCWELTVED